MSIDYKSAGVDVAAGDSLVDWLKSTQPKNFPQKDRLVDGIGGFAALFRADFPQMKEPCLVSCTDGVGTKVKLASQYGRYAEVAQDLVAMCVNDLICTGAQPLFFLDYYASGKLELKAAQSFLAAVRKACHDSDCALIGGETAEMPGVYHEQDFDCAGFAVGIVDKQKALGAHKVKVGDRLLGVSSSGFHSNGFSFLRKVFAADTGVWLEQLLKPTALYVRLAQASLAEGGVNAIAHITGGGLDNIPRVLPAGTKAELKPWVVPDSFHEVQRRSGLNWSEMVKTLNCGIGLVLVVEPDKLKALMGVVERQGFLPIDLGVVETLGRDAEAEWYLDCDKLGVKR